MWIVFAIGALVLEAFEESVDKIAIVRDKTIDSFAATFWRNLWFWIWFAVFAGTGILGPLKIFLTLPILLLALLFMCSAFFYTYLLKKVEITGSAALSYASPFLYLIVDSVLLESTLTIPQVAGILLLTTGGVLFAMNAGSGSIRKEFTPKVWAIFAYGFLLGGIQYYSFKYYLDHHGLNEISYYFNIWLVMVLAFLIIILLRNKWSAVWQTAKQHNYSNKMILSKGLDAGSSYMWLHAISLASVSQVNATNALYPLILIAVVYLLQNVFGLKAEEEFSKGFLTLKLVAVMLLVAGGFLAR